MVNYLMWSAAILVSGGVSLLACSRQAPPQRSAPPAVETAAEENGVPSFALYTLSRGKGVTPEAREALQKVEKLLEADREHGVSVRIGKKRIGLEGETRLCAGYDDRHAGARAYERVKEIVHGVELMNLVIEPCEASTDQPKQ